MFKKNFAIPEIFPKFAFDFIISFARRKKIINSLSLDELRSTNSKNEKEN